MDNLAFETSDKEIARTTRYIKDDKYIASIYGVSVERVKTVRAKDEDHYKGWHTPRIFKTHEGIVSTDGYEKHCEKMEQGSALLRDAVLTYLLTRDVNHATS